MLNRENRIRTKKEFAEIKSEGRILYSPLFGFLSCKKNDNEKKFGFVVSKKISKKAVERNKIRRRLVDIILNNMDRFEKGIRVVFLTKQEILGKTREEIEKEVLKFVK